MNESQAILSKIAALRPSLEPVPEAGAEVNAVHELERKVSDGSRQSALLDGSLRKLADPARPVSEARLPRQLTARARRMLDYGRDLLGRLRRLGDRITKSADIAEPAGSSDTDPLSRLFRETVSMTDTALRMVQAFPDSPSAQLHLCAGLEGILSDVAARVAALTSRVDRRCLDSERVELLAACLDQLDTGRLPQGGPLLDLADALLDEVQSGEPLHFLPGMTSVGGNRDDSSERASEHCRARIARFVALHGLNVAKVAGRVVRTDAELRSRPRDLVLAALIHDVGMLRVPASVVFHPDTLDDAARRAVEAHTLAAPESLSRLFADSPWLGEAIVGHHERIDGTGYPSGWRELQVPPLVRMISVCDVYAALCAARPHRAAKGTRDALADTLLLSEQGGLDRDRAQRLLTLSFYPAGTVVELTDGAVGVVVATHMGRRDVNTPSCPVVALLTDGQRHLLPVPRHLDLKECEGRHVARSLSVAEGRELLGGKFPHLAA